MKNVWASLVYLVSSIIYGEEISIWKMKPPTMRLKLCIYVTVVVF